MHFTWSVWVLGDGVGMWHTHLAPPPALNKRQGRLDAADPPCSAGSPRTRPASPSWALCRLPTPGPAQVAGCGRGPVAWSMRSSVRVMVMKTAGPVLLGRKGPAPPQGHCGAAALPAWAPCGRAHPDRRGCWSSRPYAAAAASNQGPARANAPAVGMRRPAPATRAENLSWAGRPRPERPNGYGRRHQQRNRAAEHFVEPPTIGCGLVDPVGADGCPWSAHPNNINSARRDRLGARSS